jgi:hypothetical protein
MIFRVSYFVKILMKLSLCFRKKPIVANNFSMSTSMNNRLLQNYLDLSVNSDAKNSLMTTPNKATSEQNLLKLNQKEKPCANPNLNFNSDNIRCSSDNYLASSSNEKKLANCEKKKFESMEFRNMDNFKSKETLQSNENNCKNNASLNTFSTLHGTVNVSDTDLNKMNILLKAFNENFSNRILNAEVGEGEVGDQCDIVSDYEFINKIKTISDKEANTINNNVDDNNDVYQSAKSIMEINRIPSMRRTKYSVSTIATQADMEKGSIIAERKDFKYRNQEMSDVESQILSIEVDLGSEVGGGIYGSINSSDWYNNNRRFNLNPTNNYSNNTNNNNNNNAASLALVPSTSKLSTLTNSFKDRFVSDRKECASVIVNDYSAFKNCLNFQLQAARASNMDSKISKAITTFKPINDNAQQLRNRMIVRISSISSTRSASIKRILTTTEQTMLTTTTTTTTSSSTIENNNSKEKKSSSTLVSSSSVIPLSTVSCSEGLSSTQSFESPTKRQPFFSLHQSSGGGGSIQNETNRNESENASSSSSSSSKHMEPLVYEAYRAAVHQFPNNLYMYLDSVPYFKSCFQDGLLNPNDYKDKVILFDNGKKLKIVNNDSENAPPPAPPPPPPLPPSSSSKLRQSSTLNTILDLNDDSINSSKLEESFNKCYEANATRFKAKRKNENKTRGFCVHENEISDPNTIYSQVETDENETGKSMTDEEEVELEEGKENDSSSATSCASSLANNYKKMPSLNINQSSTSSVEKELASFNLCSNVGVGGGFTSRFNTEKEITFPMATKSSPISGNEDAVLKMSKAERLKKMLEEERKALSLARKETPKYSESKYTIESPRKQKRLKHPLASTPSTNNHNHHYLRRSRDRPKQMISSLFKINKRSELKFEPTNNFNSKNKEDDDSTSSSIAAQKNVRFSDNVSYI